MKTIISEMIQQRNRTKLCGDNTDLHRREYRKYLALQCEARVAFTKRHGSKQRRRFGLEALAQRRNLRRISPSGYPFWDHQNAYSKDGRPWAIEVSTYADRDAIELEPNYLAAEYGLACYHPPHGALHNPHSPGHEGCTPVVVVRVDDDVPPDWHPSVHL
jgi:hypothetical protein